LRRNGSVDIPLRGEANHISYLVSLVGQSISSCIDWPFKKYPNGYGAVSFMGKATTAHRVAATLAFGAAPNAKMDAAHSCHNRSCVNPNHLRWATKSENQADRTLAGTSNDGSKNGNAKLREQDVIEIINSHESSGVIAARFGVNRQCINRIRNGKRWSLVTGLCGPEGIHWRSRL